MHELPQLGKLEQAYADELVVIGVQSPKYPAESDPENLRAAVQRYGLEHPVVNDPEYRVWDAYAVTAWPTLVFLSPRGTVVGSHAGEAPFDALARAMDDLIAESERDGSLVRGRRDLQVESWSRPIDELAFPGKVLATSAGVFIADSGHHRIVETDPAGNVRRVIGDGIQGFADGAFGSARFNRPQGMAFDGSTLYVADSDNHAVRAVDLDRDLVHTVAGTGEQAYRLQRRGLATETALSSPWDLSLTGGTLSIAMAGFHQIWALDLRAGTVGVWAGTGHEGIRDGSLQSAWLAQPMGLSLHDSWLFVACAETQAVRSIETGSDAVTTLVGRGLFEFGDEDGPALSATLQHVQDLAAADGVVFIADTYNNKIKRLDLGADRVETYLGSGTPGVLDGPGPGARLNEPSGLSLLGNTLYIADTNNHLIRTADLESGHLRTFTLHGLEPHSG